MTTLVDGRFVARPNRFVVQARLTDGRLAEAHLADPGRLRDLLVPGAELRLRPVPADARRKTRFTVALVRSAAPRTVWVSLETTRANLLADRLFAAGSVAGYGPEWKRRREVPHQGHRFDFLLARGPRVCWVEVKSVTWVEGDVGLFPDAPTARGLRHVQSLTAQVETPGVAAMVLFVVQRGDAREVRPSRRIDPAFADALQSALAAGVQVRAATFRLDARGAARFAGMVPVTASPPPVQLPAGDGLP
jgi:sugar fermentation stimulation protein A